MKSISITDILELSVPERIHLVEEIWDSIASQAEALPVTKNQKKELERRLTAFEKEPRKGSSWKTVKARIKPNR